MTITHIAQTLRQSAQADPQRIAMRCPGKRGDYSIALTYGQLDARSEALARGLRLRSIERGMRVVLMVRPTPEFFLAMFALFKLGAVPVLVDPGIDKRSLRQCLDEAEAQAFIGIPLALFARKLLGWARSARIVISAGTWPLFAETTLARVEADGNAATGGFEEPNTNDVAAILFTSGSTGVPKGVVYRHRHFVAQIAMLRDAFGIQPGGVDLPTFPPFALFDPALGLTSIIPDMDPTRPARANPAKLHAAIARFGVTQLFGSPALMRVLAQYGQPLPSIRRATSAGAPVPPQTVATLLELLPDDAQFWTPYGATECLPVAVIEGSELLRLRTQTENGAGTCVGRAAQPNVVRIIAIDDGAIERWQDVLELAQGEVGEITVAGPTATDSYFNRDVATRLSKITETLADGSTRVVHRMGDLGWLDEQGRLWFCGRKSQRVVKDAHTTLCTEQVEPVFNTHPAVARTALVGVGPAGAQRAFVCVELRAGIAAAQWPRIAEELRRIADSGPWRDKIDGFLHYPHAFPVDIRHNAKISREKLAAWASRRLAGSRAGS